MQDEIIVSVICLCYNHENYIRDALNGFVMQKTNFKFEVFVHDDASTDGSAAIIMEYAEKYPELIIPIIQKENQYSKGLKISRTFVFPRVHGKYIATCEGDDYWTSPDKLQKQVDFLETHPDYSACAHNARFYNVQTGESYPGYGLEDRDLSMDDIVSQGGAFYQTATLMYRSVYMLSETPPFLGALVTCGDYSRDIFLRLKGKIYYSAEQMTLYRAYVPGSWTERTRKDKQFEIKQNERVINMLKMANDYSEHKYDEIFSKYIRVREQARRLLLERAEFGYYKSSLKDIPDYLAFISTKNRRKLKANIFLGRLLPIAKGIKDILVKKELDDHK